MEFTRNLLEWQFGATDSALGGLAGLGNTLRFGKPRAALPNPLGMPPEQPSGRLRLPPEQPEQQYRHYNGLTQQAMVREAPALRPLQIPAVPAAGPGLQWGSGWNSAPATTRLGLFGGLSAPYGGPGGGGGYYGGGGGSGAEGAGAETTREWRRR